MGSGRRGDFTGDDEKVQFGQIRAQMDPPNYLVPKIRFKKL